MDDQEVTIPRGGGWEPRGQPFPPLLPHNQVEGGNQEDSLLTPSTLLNSDEDVGCLINTLATGLQLGTSWINTFSGEAMPGKMEVLFKQWYHEVQCIKDHYPESVIRESIVHSFKWAVVDMTRYMGPTTSRAHILQTLTVIFGTLASFDILMQNFYKVTQSNHEKVPSSATMALKGPSIRSRLQCPGRIMDQEVQQHLKDCLFHGVHKHIRDSIQYLYSNLRTTYSQLMITACKVESENEKAQDKVRARSAVTTKFIGGTTELGNQIARLMAALT